MKAVGHRQIFSWFMSGLPLAVVLSCSERIIPGDIDPVGATSASSGEEDNSSSPPSSMTTASNSGGSQPGSQPGRPSAPAQTYSVCTGASECSVGNYCIMPRDEAGFCTEACPREDRTCPSIDGFESLVECLELGNASMSYCVVRCAEGGGCPEGMRCEDVSAAGEAHSVCF